MITVFGCPVNSDYLEMLLKSAGYDPADESGVVKIVATDDGKVTVHWPSGGTSELVNASSSMTFLSLPDTPDSYSGSETFYVKVNSAGTDLVFVSGGGTETDELVKTSSADSTAGYLGDKIDTDTMAVDTANQTIKVKDGVFASAGHTHSWGDVSKSGSKLSDLGDVPAYQADKVLGVDSSGTTLQWVDNSGGGGTAGATTYLELDDTPSSYSGQAGKVPVVKSDESGLDWFDAASAGHTHNWTDLADTATALSSYYIPVVNSSGSTLDFNSDTYRFKRFGNYKVSRPFVFAGDAATTASDKYLQLKLPSEVVTSGGTNKAYVSFEVDVCNNYYGYGYKFICAGLVQGASTHGGWYYPKTIGISRSTPKNLYYGYDPADNHHCIWIPGPLYYSVVTVTNFTGRVLDGDYYTWADDWECSIVSALGTTSELADITPELGATYLSDTTAQHSITVSSGKSMLVGDEASPGAWKVYGTNGSGTRGWYDMETPKYTKLIAYNTDGRPEYVGEADPGTATSASSWRIKKLTYDTDGNITAVKWADGNSNFDNVWDNRTSYSYS